MPQRWNIYEPLRPHFVTNSVIHLIPAFCTDEYFRVLVDSLRYCVESRELRVHAFVLMPNHFHMVCSQSGGDISGVIRDLKRYTSGEMTRMMERDGRHTWLRAMRNAARTGAEAAFWDPEFHPEQIHSEPFCKQKCDYIHNNPVKAGYVEEPSHWKYSSAGFYYEDREPVIPIEPIM